MFVPISMQLLFAVQCVVANLRHPGQNEGFRANNGLASLQNLQTLARVFEDQLLRFQDHAERIRQLESKQLAGCETTTKDDLIRHLVDRVDALEDRLNRTQRENDALRRELTSPKRKLDGARILHRTTRNLHLLPEANETEINEIDNALRKKAAEKCKPTVAFDAYRNKPFHEAQAFVTFDGTTVNTGEAFNAETGKFVAPVKGIYSFAFHGLTQDGRATYVKIIQNGRNVAGAYRRHEGEGDEEHNYEEAGLRRAEGMLAQSVLLELDKDDEVAVFAYHGNLRDGGWHYTHFTGYLI